jgi:hypothetical protein
MSLTTFLAFSILGCDFLIFAFFQWLYGDIGAKPETLDRSSGRSRRRFLQEEQTTSECEIVSGQTRDGDLYGED